MINAPYYQNLQNRNVFSFFSFYFLGGCPTRGVFNSIYIYIPIYLSFYILFRKKKEKIKKGVGYECD